jgi:coniferyl-aldehyde dehydrogenase
VETAGLTKPVDHLRGADQLYYFDWNEQRADQVLEKTHSGGACINDTMSHVMADDIPFGGIGPSGMGHYHGEEGFKTFSKAKGIVRKGKINATALVGPPWNNSMFKGLVSMQAFKHRPRKIK